MRRGQPKAAQKCSPAANGDSLLASSDESFRIDAVVGKSDLSQASSTVGGKGPVSSIAPSTGAKSVISSLTQSSLNSEIGSLSKKKKKPTIQKGKAQANRPVWLTAFYIFITAVSLFGILTDRSREPTTKNFEGLRKIQYMAPSPDEFASLRRELLNKTHPQRILAAPTNEYHVFHIAPVSNLGNNLLNAILMGMFDSSDAYFAQVYYNAESSEFETWHRNEKASCTATIVSQTNETDALVLEKNFGKVFQNVFFVALKSPRVPDCAAPPENMICFEYNEMAYEDEASRTSVVQGVINKLQDNLPYFSNIKFDMGRVNFRLDGMERAIAKMLDKPVNEVDPQYGTRGQKPIKAPEMIQVDAEASASTLTRAAP